MRPADDGKVFIHKTAFEKAPARIKGINALFHHGSASDSALEHGFVHDRPCAGLVVDKLDLTHRRRYDDHIHIFHSELTLGVCFASDSHIFTVNKSVHEKVAALGVTFGIVCKIITENEVAHSPTTISLPFLSSRSTLFLPFTRFSLTYVSVIL